MVPKTNPHIKFHLFPANRLSCSDSRRADHITTNSSSKVFIKANSPFLVVFFAKLFSGFTTFLGLRYIYECPYNEQIQPDTRQNAKYAKTIKRSIWFYSIIFLYLSLVHLAETEACFKKKRVIAGELITYS